MVSNTYVLGINDGHDSSVSIVKNGEVIAAIAEERLRNVKHACKALLDTAGI